MEFHFCKRTIRLARDLKFPFQHNPDRFGVCDVFLLKNARRKRVLVVGVQHGYGLLHDDGAVIEFLIHEVHRAA